MRGGARLVANGRQLRRPAAEDVVLLNAVLVSVTVMTLFERKIIAWCRCGWAHARGAPRVLQRLPTRQVLLKEDITPGARGQMVFTLAPILSMVPALMRLRYPIRPRGDLLRYTVPLFIADINVGLLYVVSITSIGVYGIILAGYSSNSKFPLLAGLRASAQLISYEIAVTMMLVSMVVTAGTLSMVGIVEAQRAHGVWYAFLQPIAFVILFIGGLAETNRAPFDMPEAEQVLTGGFHTEPSGMRFARFFFLARIRQHDCRVGRATTRSWRLLGPFRTSRRCGCSITSPAGCGSS